MTVPVFQQKEKHLFINFSLGALRNISLEKALLYDGKITLIPGKKLCASCRKELLQLNSTEDSSESETIDEHENDFEMHTYNDDTEFTDINNTLCMIGCSPVTSHSKAKSTRISAAKRKVEQVKEKIEGGVAKKLNLSTDELNPKNDRTCSNCSDYYTFLEELKNEIQNSSYMRKLQLLTISPESWTIEKRAKEFGVTVHAIKRSKALKKEFGIIPEVASKIGKSLSEDTIYKVKMFYQDDEFTRMCPGAKEYKSVRINNDKVKMQKRLHLVNLKELHLEFKKKHPDNPIGLSKFCELRPKWVVSAGDSGCQNVCVCEQHQNIKLLVNAVPVKIDYKDVFKTSMFY
ncbi:MAG: hypothetical protein MK200_06485 [Nitrosopumilus sp.]|nr:hypothetical protein [Nitrosopumilus sp.]